MRIEKRWTLKPADNECVKNLADVLKVHPAICRLLAVRGIYDYDSAKIFPSPIRTFT